MPREDVGCAVGRLITRNDDLGELDWKTPCPDRPGSQRFLIQTRDGELALPPFHLCVPHAVAWLPAMEAARLERLAGNSK